MPKDEMHKQVLVKAWCYATNACPLPHMRAFPMERDHLRPTRASLESMLILNTKDVLGSHLHCPWREQCANVCVRTFFDRTTG